MGPKKKKVKRQLTDEEKKAKAELMALQAEEARKKKIRARRDSILQAKEAEEKISTFNMHKIHMDWRTVMRNENAQAMHDSIEQIAEEYDHKIKVKKGTIERLTTRLDEADEQYEFASNNHAHTLSTLIDLHHTRVQIMEADFQSKLQRIEEEFSKERLYITSKHEKNKKELKDMMAAMENEFQKALNELRQEFESTREELKNKSTEDYNVAKISLEGTVEDLENQIQETHQTYLSSTEAKTIAFKKMVKKDTIMARLIEQRMRKLIRLHELLAYWRARIGTNSREWEASNKALRQEKDRINKHYQDLKRSLNKMHTSEHEKLKEISKMSGEACIDLKGKLVMGRRLIKLGELNRKLETEYEQIFTFDPFNITSTSPSTDDQSDIPNTLKPFSNWQIGAPKAGETNAAPKSGGDQKMTSWAVDDTGNEVHELNYFDNMNKKFNKVMLEKMALNLERKRLTEANHQLQKQLEHCLDTSPSLKRKFKTSLPSLGIS
ncbi:unnamed protein product [Calypogeia fissa]